jgi:hypothetical protein
MRQGRRVNDDTLLSSMDSSTYKRRTRRLNSGPIAVSKSVWTVLKRSVKSRCHRKKDTPIVNQAHGTESDHASAAARIPKAVFRRAAVGTETTAESRRASLGSHGRWHPSAAGCPVACPPRGLHELQGQHHDISSRINIKVSIDIDASASMCMSMSTGMA